MIGAAALLLGACGGNADAEPDDTTVDTTATTTTSSTTTGPALAANQHHVGELVLTIHERIDDAPAGEVFDPEPGTRWIAFDVEYANPTDEAVFVSTYGTMELVMSDNRRTDPELIGTNDEPPVDGDISPGSSLRGWVTFQVPDDVDPTVLRVGTADNSGPAIEISL